jgi:hypothetical protein
VESVFGRVQLEDGVADAQVHIETLAGAVLTEDVSTNDSGIFIVPRFNAQSFRVVGTVAGAEFSSAYDESTPATKMLEVNAVTSVVDRYHILHPELNVAQAEARVKTFLGIPTEIDVKSGVYGVRHSRFSHTEFLRQATATPGGASAYLDQLAQSVDSVSARTLAQSDSGSPPPSLSPLALGGEDQELLSNLVFGGERPVASSSLVSSFCC